MRKVRPQDVRNDFATLVTERLQHFDRLELALKGTAHEKRDLTTLTEVTLHSIYVAFECFLSDLLLAYINRDPSQYQQNLEVRIRASVQSKFGHWASGRMSFAATKHIKLDELEEALDPDRYNLTFKDVATLKQRCAEWVALPHRNGVMSLGDADSRLIDTVHAIRNFIAHRSPNAKTIMNDRLATVITGPTCPNLNLNRGAHYIHNIGSFLKAKPGGVMRMRQFAMRLNGIAAGL
ncbi:MAG: hypothetical protein KatS3mg126_0079 [Lysobacteraceae bacterium]|nr:MAG: hypothetical protein KatS3mg082_3245 [Nitrospiraceae bacterium]GIX34300.1 MAG: hypothetical protein KatS3mg126_0079 [Xanthomonadaceae bacterium]